MFSDYNVFFCSSFPINVNRSFLVANLPTLISILFTITPLLIVEQQGRRQRIYIVITFIISRYTHKGFISYLQTSCKLHNRSKLSNLKRKSAVVVTEFTLGILNIKVIFVWIHWIPYNIHTSIGPDCRHLSNIFH